VALGLGKCAACHAHAGLSHDRSETAGAGLAFPPLGNDWAPRPSSRPKFSRPRRLYGRRIELRMGRRKGETPKRRRDQRTSESDGLTQTSSGHGTLKRGSGTRAWAADTCCTPNRRQLSPPSGRPSGHSFADYAARSWFICLLAGVCSKCPAAALPPAGRWAFPREPRQVDCRGSPTSVRNGPSKCSEPFPTDRVG
jgi:hypothetical protein